MDLHAWITQQVDAVEAAARSALKGRRVIVQPHGGGAVITGTVTEVKRTPGELDLTIARYGVEPRDETAAPVQLAAAVLRRCEADRRILARHRLAAEDQWGWIRDPGCRGCGVMGDCDDPVTDNLNDCPELLDLAHAHGITPEILAGLDRPQPPEPKPLNERYANGGILTPPITTSDLPAALRGPRWKP